MRVDRLVSMIMILLDKKRISAQELADRFEVSSRTIYRDIDSINMAGIPIHSTPGVGGGFEIMEAYKLDKNIFSTTDLSVILMGLSNVSSLIQDEELVNALAKVQSFVPPDKADDIELKANQLQIDLTPWLGNKNIQPYLEIIKTALQESRLLSFDYADRHGDKTTRMVEPYQLILKNSQWYWQGYCYKRNDFRLFRLSRMSSLQLQKEAFAPREHPKPQLDAADHLATLQTTITLRVHQSAMDRMLEYCTDEQVFPDTEGYCIVHFPFIENDYYYNILFSFGDKCECLEPAHIRTEIQRRIHDIASLYEESE